MEDWKLTNIKNHQHSLNTPPKTAMDKIKSFLGGSGSSGSAAAQAPAPAGAVENPDKVRPRKHFF